MCKRILSLALSIALVLSLGISAVAASEGASADLSRVTLAVKSAVNIKADYEEFNGTFEEDGPVRRWYLHWYGDMESVDVTADDSGKVLSYSFYDDSAAYYSYSEYYAPKFPATTYASAKTVADSFLKGVLGSGEGCTWNDSSANTNLGASYYNFNGTLTKNGVPTEIIVRLRVRVADSKVSYYYRSDAYELYTSGVPSAKAAVGESSARTLLDGAVKLELQYVLDESGKNAVLRYVPQYTGRYIVDAQTGSLINLDEVYSGLNTRGGANATASAATEEAGEADSANGAYLTPIEEEGISKLEGVRPKEELDSFVRSQTALGVDEGWNLRSASYSRPDDDAKVFCELSYYRPESDTYSYKSVRLDARTTALESMYTYNGEIDAEKADRTALLETAEQFLSALWPTEFAATRLTSGEESVYSFRYSQYVNGVPFYVNGINISVDPTTGKLLSFSKSWNDSFTFAPKGELVTEAKATSNYAATFETVLGYVNWPVEALPGSNDPFLKGAAEAGYTYVNTLKLAYRYGEGKGAYGVDAVTGEVLCRPTQVSPKLSYSDLSASYAQAQVSALAEYGIGYAGGQLRPRDLVTQRELIGLLISATGVRIADGIDDETADFLYSLAYGYGMLTEAERNDNATVTRAEMVRRLISATEYASAAKLSGIFKTSFADDGSIPEAEKGYVAIAKAIGLVNGDSKGCFNPTKGISRQDAAIILYKYMSR